MIAPRRYERAGRAACAAAAMMVIVAGSAPTVAQGPDARAPIAPRGAVVRTGVDLVSLAVTVERADGSPVTALGAQQFRVFEDGVEQHVAFFGRGEVPLDLVLLLDTSASMAPHLSLARTAAADFTRALRPHDRAAVMSFGARAELAVPFTTDRRQVEEAIGRQMAGGTTALYNAVYVALTEFGTQRAHGDEMRRRALVVFSDGYDTTSLIPFDAVLELARRAGVAAYTVSLKPSGRTSDPDLSYAKAEFEMRTLARETGARSFFPESMNELNAIYGVIARELASQYSIGYVPRERGGRLGFRKVTVAVDHPNVVARTRTGYVGRSAASVHY